MLSREERLTTAVQFFATREDIPVFPKHVHGVIQLTEGDGQSFERLIEILEQSYAFSMLLLREANQEAKLRDARRVSSVRRAVTTLGLWRLRDLATRLRGDDSFHRFSSSARDLMFRSSVGSQAARLLAELADPTLVMEASVTGMFRLLGEFLMSCHLPDLYEEIRIQQAASGDPLEVVCTEVLQFTYEDLAQRVAREWGWPENLIRSLRASRPLAVTGGSSDRLNTITACSHALVECLGQGAAADAFDRVIADYGPLLQLGPASFRQILHKSCEETINVWSGAMVQMDARRIRRQMQAALSGSDPGEGAAAPPAEAEAQSAEPSVAEDLSRLAAATAPRPSALPEPRVYRY